MIARPGPVDPAQHSSRPRAPLRAVIWAALATAAFLVGLGVRSDVAPTLFRLWALALGTIGLALLCATLLRDTAAESLPRRRQELRLRWPGRRRPPRRAETPALTEIERIVAFSTSNAFDVHFRLRPRLAAITNARLRRHGLSLSAAPETVRPLLGEELWDLVRADRPAPEQRHGPRLAAATIARAVESLDAL